MPDHLIGQDLGRYHILEQLGQGGMAVVYKAFDTSLERPVALKVILPYREHSERFLVRFRREARALAKLSHPNILKIFDYGEYENQPYLVMEYIPGGTLAQRLKGKPIPWQEAAQFLARIARALETAHEQGIIHRDVKPSNILLANGREPMLSDFGIAKLIENDEETADLTGSGVGIGTPEYMAPEQGLGRADERADIYALGVVFYEMVTGHRPYQADTPMAIMLKKNTEPLPRPTQYVPSLPSAVENTLIKALARDPQHRYPNMSAFAAALEGLTVGHKETSPVTTTFTSAPTTDDPQLDFKSQDRTRKRPGGWVVWVAAGVLGAVCCAALLGGATFWQLLSAAPTRTAAATEVVISNPTQTPKPTSFPTNTFTPPPSPTFIPSATWTPTMFPTEPPPHPSGQWIAFNSERSGDSEIYLVDTSGNNLTQLTNNSVHDRYPSWSPDGQYLVYQINEGDDAELAIMEVATRQVIQLTGTPCHNWGPVWSPDGQWIAFYSGCNDNQREIYKVRFNGSDLQQLTSFSGVYSWFPAWSPDGSKITFSSNRSGKYYVYSMNADGSDQVQLTRGCISSFSPDGSQILYGEYCNDTSDLWLMNSDGSNSHPLTSGYECKNGAWSPDGQHIVFQVSQAGADGPFALYILSLAAPDPSNWIMIADYNVDGVSPAWQP
jgi:Tol biopolymer transport system component